MDHIDVDKLCKALAVILSERSGVAVTVTVTK